MNKIWTEVISKEGVDLSAKTHGGFMAVVSDRAVDEEMLGEQATVGLTTDVTDPSELEAKLKKLERKVKDDAGYGFDAEEASMFIWNLHRAGFEYERLIAHYFPKICPIFVKMETEHRNPQDNFVLLGPRE